MKTIYLDFLLLVNEKMKLPVSQVVEGAREHASSSQQWRLKEEA